jgi:hypothetical protein
MRRPRPRSGRAAGLLVITALLAATAAWAQAGPGSRGCCCLGQSGSYVCDDKTQAECLAIQPAAPTFPHLADWKKAWNDWIAASKAQEAKPMRGGWIAESCEKTEARVGCCCFPPLGQSPRQCKAEIREFDCRAECALLRDGRKPSDCTWTGGACGS